MTKPQSRAIGGFLKAILAQEGIECSDYPTLSIIRNSPQGQIDIVWSVQQLANCYALTDSYIIQAQNVQVSDQTGKYEVDYFSIVLYREDKDEPWMVNVFTNTEDIYPNTEDQKILGERFTRFGERAKKAILAFVE